VAKDADWVQKDDYYWQGPDGWTICRVILKGHVEQYEICQPGKPVWIDSRPTLTAAIKRHAELTS